MIQEISSPERLNMLPEDYFLRKQFLLKDIKEELSLVISLIENNPYSSDLKEYVKCIQGEINELGYFCILPNPESPNAYQCYQRTLVFLQTLTERDCRNLSLDQYNNIDVFDTLGELVCKHINICNDLLIQFLPNKEKVETEVREHRKLIKIFNKARITSLTSEDEEILSRYFLKYKTKINDLSQRCGMNVY
jgi:hypothetical protein